MTESEELVGKLSFESRLPQYLCGQSRIQAKPAGFLLDNRNVHRRSGADTVDFLLLHAVLAGFTEVLEQGIGAKDV